MKPKKPLSTNKTIMLIDDNEIDNFINEKMIRSAHFAENIYVHTSAKSALEFLKNISALDKAPSELIPAFIFLDINMPILDGFHFLEEFEKFSSEFKSRIKIIMLTTSLNPSDIEKTKPHKSVVKYLFKPLIDNDLNDLTSGKN